MAFQTIVGTRLAQAAITTAYLAVYNVPTVTRTYIKDIMICNTTGSAITVNVHLVNPGVTPSASNALFYGYSVAANSVYHWTGTQIINESSTIQVNASGTGATITISGGEAT